MGYDDVPAITVTNHCASSLSAVMTGYAGIQAGSYRSVIVGGVESMSGVTIYADEYKRKAISKFKQKTNILELINYYLEHVRCLRILEKTDIRNPVTRKCVYNEIEHLGGLMDEACSKDRVFETGLDMLKYAHQAQKVFDIYKKNKFLRDLVPFESDFVVDADEFDFEKRAWEMLRPDFKDHRYPSVVSILISVLFFKKSRWFREADGAAANLLMEESEALRQNLSPKAFIRDVTVTGNELKYRSRFGVLSSMALLLSKNSLFIEDISVLEIHENSAVEMLFLYDCIQDPKKLVHLLPEVPRKSEEPFNVREICNTWGGSLAFGHPFGATGVRLITTACNRLHHDPNARYAVVSMTSYGGTGISILLEKYT
ncbi:Trifunctional enzyme subunit beta, mitochondrial [Thelohanellus kitauei]|uniref:acetyl-CoA C-acyltransferase n=1 Tax=Thelohanellus kitauei TaxID=669202 RepID=A0A0C2MU34_THEKT|nr:Trifunctional enzyme subunit beta, mitochondrial [Thelohanellus kitauei]